jgi:choline-sulfatase
MKYSVATAAASGSVLGGCQGQGQANSAGAEKPNNILIIIADQLSQKALPSYGDKYADAPNIESIMTGGVRFSQAYTPTPLCQPARAAFWTSRYPHQTGVVSNLIPEPNDIFTTRSKTADEKFPALGEIFSDAGYICRHFGKMHDAGALRGFVCDDPAKTLPVEAESPAFPINIDTTRDRYTAAACEEFLKQKHEKPFIAIADFNNPHNICGWVGENAGEHEDKPIDGVLPELPDNFEIEDIASRAPGIQYLCCTHPRLNQACHWNKNNYRHYLAAYYHYLKLVDNEIGGVLNALKQSGDDKNTLVVFMTDHGDGMASHRMATKRLGFYEETTRVPLAFAGAGITGKNKVVSEPLVSLLDIVPTLCDYAGIEQKGEFEGESLCYYLTGKGKPIKREYLVSQWHCEWNFTYEPGRMLRSQRFKYIKYAENKAEELYDMINDPGERANLAHKPEYQEILARHREMFARYLKETNDPFEDMKAFIDPRWRKHQLGYSNHEGGCSRDCDPPKELDLNGKELDIHNFPVEI